MANQLASETSLDLLQHAENPVRWHPWGESALQKAVDLDKPIFLSIGYSACHWCHVMAHESFEDDGVAAILNEHFVSIKVDREERPDLDQIYMTAVQALTGSGGWPMSVFLTPQGIPFYGGTYFPPKPRNGMHSFTQVLNAVVDAWQNRRQELVSGGQRLLAAIERHGESEHDCKGAELSMETLHSAFRALRQSFDMVNGGWGEAPKFPQPMALELLLRYHHSNANTSALEMVTRSLEAMARGGMYDQLGGGFHRYSVDDHWLVPHFERMLYDNAQLPGADRHTSTCTPGSSPAASSTAPSPRKSQTTLSAKCSIRRACRCCVRNICQAVPALLELPDSTLPRTPTVRARKASSLSGRRTISAGFWTRKRMPSWLPMA